MEVETPDLQFTREIEQIVPGFTRVVNQQSTEGKPWWQTAAELLPTLVLADYQRDLMRLQLERARNNLPPIAAADYGVGVNFNLSPQTRNALMIGGGLLLAAISLYFLSNKRS